MPGSPCRQQNHPRQKQRRDDKRRTAQRLLPHGSGRHDHNKQNQQQPDRPEQLLKDHPYCRKQLHGGDRKVADSQYSPRRTGSRPGRQAFGRPPAAKNGQQKYRAGYYGRGGGCQQGVGHAGTVAKQPKALGQRQQAKDLSAAADLTGFRHGRSSFPSGLRRKCGNCRFSAFPSRPARTDPAERQAPTGQGAK